MDAQIKTKARSERRREEIEEKEKEKGGGDEKGIQKKENERKAE